MGKLSSEDRKKYQTISRVIGIFVRIGHIFCWVGVAGLAIATIAVAAVAPNVKVNSSAKEIAVFDEKINYSIKDKEIELGEGDDKITIKDNEIKIGQNGTTVAVKLSNSDIDEIEKFIENDLSKLVSVAPYILALVTAAVAFMALALGHGASVFKNIAKEKTPFIKDNAERTEKAAKYLIVCVVVSFIANLITSVAMAGKAGSSIMVGSISTILALYVMVYIFKAGYELESVKSSKTKDIDKNE